MYYSPYNFLNCRSYLYLFKVLSFFANAICFSFFTYFAYWKLKPNYYFFTNEIFCHFLLLFFFYFFARCYFIVIVIALFMKNVKYLLKSLEQTLWLFVLSSIRHGSPSSINAQDFAFTVSWLDVPKALLFSVVLVV